MTSTPITYDVVKISELEPIDRALNGNDVLVVNDLLEDVTQTKSCTVVQLANSMKQYVLPIATAEVVGGIRVGQGLVINSTTGVLDVTAENINIGDLLNINIDQNALDGEFITYNSDNGVWEDTYIPQAYVVNKAGDGIQIVDRVQAGDSEQFFSVKPGEGIIIKNDEVAVNPGAGIRIINDQVSISIGDGLESNNGVIQLSVDQPLYLSDSKAVALKYGPGLLVDNTGTLILDTSMVPELTVTGGLIVPGDLEVQGKIVANNASVKNDFHGDVRIRGSITNGMRVSGASTLNGNFFVVGNSTLTGTLSVSGFTRIVNASFQVDEDCTINRNLAVIGDITADEITTNGKVEAGSITSAGSIAVTGDVTASGNITATDYNTTSDARLKENVETIDGALDKVNSLRGVTFDWKRDGNPGTGVIAQELEEVLPRLVVGEEQKSVNYNGLIGVLIQAVKELSKEVEELKNK